MRFLTRSEVAQLCFNNLINALMLEDTNPQESLHRSYYITCGKNNTLVEGFKRLALFVGNQEAKIMADQTGIRKCYGKGRVATPRHRYNAQIKNDGRAPDTLKELQVTKKKSKKREGFDTSDGDLSVKRGKSSYSASTSKAGRPKGSPNANKDPRTSYQSYKHNNNTCYITALLESLFATYRALQGWDEIKSLPDLTKLLTTIQNHFEVHQ